MEAAAPADRLSACPVQCYLPVCPLSSSTAAQPSLAGRNGHCSDSSNQVHRPLLLLLLLRCLLSPPFSSSLPLFLSFSRSAAGVHSLELPCVVCSLSHHAVLLCSRLISAARQFKKSCMYCFVGCKPDALIWQSESVLHLLLLVMLVVVLVVVFQTVHSDSPS